MCCQVGGIDIVCGVDVVEVYWVYKGDDGLSYIEWVKIFGKKGVYYGGMVWVMIFEFGDLIGVLFVYGELNMVIFVYLVLYCEIFIILSGFLVVKDGFGKVYLLKFGLMFIVDDFDIFGCFGMLGLCGYVVFLFVYKVLVK